MKGIAESYLAEECMRFFGEFLRKSHEKEVRNEDDQSDVILEGRPISACKIVTLSSNEKESAHLVVLRNMTMVEPYIE